MSDPAFRQLLIDLRDPDKYVRVSGVAVFDEHADEVWVKDGQRVRPNTPGAKKTVHRFTREKLERLAEFNNRRASQGDPSTLVFGHTSPDEPDETKQPAPRGYVLNYRVQYDRARERWMLRGDYFIRRKDYADAETYPFTSIEIFPDDGTILPVSLLRRAPARNLGQWTYSANGRLKLRYSMEFSPMPDDFNPGAPPAVPPDAPMGDEEMAAQFLRHVFSHPGAAAMCAKYGAADVAPPSPPPGPDPTAAPDADAMPPEPDQFMAFPSATNAGVPPLASGKPDQHARNGKSVPQARSGPEAARYARYDRMLEAQQEEIRVLREKSAEGEAREIVTALVNDGFELDVTQEVVRFSRLDAAAREERASDIRRYHRQDLAHPVGRVPLEPSRGRVVEIDLDDPESMSREDQEKVFQYSRKHNQWDFATAARAVFKDRLKK